jgi:general secretion pathway protein G
MLRKLNKKQGFTLVEILIVVGIITMLAALSVHGLLRARMTANEAAAIKGLRTLQAAMDSYRLANGRYPSFAGDGLQELVSANPQYLDNSWDPGNEVGAFRNGYRIEIKYVFPDTQEYFLMADPIQVGVTGNRSFMLSQYRGIDGGSGEITSGGVGLGSAGAPN